MSSLRWWLVIVLGWSLALPAARAQCACSQGDKIRIGLRLSARFAGTIQTTITVAGNTVATRSMSAGSVGFNSSTGRYFPQSFGCGEWPDTVFVEVAMGEKVSEEIVFTTVYETNSTNPAYTDLDPSAPYILNGMAFPSAPCIAYWVDPGTGEYVRYEFSPLSSVLYDGTLVARLQVRLDAEDDASVAGTSTGPEAGVVPVPKPRDDFVDASPISSRCTAPAAAREAASEAKTARRPVKALETLAESARVATAGLEGPVAQFVCEPRTLKTAGGEPIAGPMQRGTAQPVPREFALGKSATVPARGGVAFAPPSPTVALAAIGALRLPLDFGGNQGQLLYSAVAIDAAAYSPQRLTLGSESAVVQRVNSAGGVLRQAMLGATFVDVVTLSPAAFEVRFYAPAQIGAYNPGSGLFPVVDDNPSAVWRIENPDTLPVANRVRFRETRGGVTHTHLATWTAASGDNAGTMTIARYDEAVVESRTYTLGAFGDANTRTEHVVRRGPGTGGPVSAEYVETYQEFYHWGQPGQVLEALIARVDDPAGAALTTQYVYYDDPGMPAGSLNGVIFPDGYWEVYTRFGGSGEVAQLYRPYRDDPASPFGVQPEDGRFTTVAYHVTGPTNQVRVEEEFLLGAGPVKRSVVYLDYYPSFGVRVETTNRFLDETRYTQSQIVTDWRGREIIEEYAADRSYQQHVSQLGFWNPNTEVFTPGFASGLRARRTFTIEGSLDHPDGVANRTLIRVSVADERGHDVLEEEFVHTGTTPNPSAWTRTDSIRRTVRKYDALGRVLTVKVDGQLVAETAYGPDGRVSFAIDEFGVRSDFTYDHFGRVATRIRTLAAGDPVQTTTYAYDASDRLRFETVSATKAGITRSLVTEQRYDLAGRLTATVSPAGLTTTYDETILTDGGGNAVAKRLEETSPSGATTITEAYRDRQPYALTGTAVAARYFLHGTAVIGGARFESRQTYATPEFTGFREDKINDWAGNTISLTRPGVGGAGYLTRTATFDGGASEDGSIRGLRARTTEPGEHPMLYSYDEFGRLSAAGQDANGNGVLDLTGTDPVTTSTQVYERANASAPWFLVNTESRLLTNGSSTLTPWAQTRQQLSGRAAGVIAAGETLRRDGHRFGETLAMNRTTKTRTRVRRDLATAAGSQPETSTEVAGLLRTVRRPAATADIVYTYDALGRTETAADPVSGTLTYAYNAAGQVQSITDSAVPARVVQYLYHPDGSPGAGQVSAETDPDGHVTRFSYTVRDQLFRRWGRNSHPVEHTYHDDGQLASLRTFRSEDLQNGGPVDWSQPAWPANAPAGDLTRWLVDPATGLPTAKRFADYNAADAAPIETAYTYDAAARLHTRTNARGQTMTRGYDAAGRLQTLTYSAGSGTANVTFGYDRGGRTASVVDGTGSRTLSYTSFDQLDDETHTAGLLAGKAVNRGYDASARRNSLLVAGVMSLGYDYDSLSRWQTVTDSSEAIPVTFTTGYQSGSNQVASVETRRNGALRFTSVRSHDGLARMTGIELRDSANQVLVRHGYAAFDAFDRRLRVDREDGKSWHYAYNPRGEIVFAFKQHAAAAGGEKLGGWQTTYRYDTIGNRLETTTGGNGGGTGLHSAVFQPNALNQYAQRTVPGSVFLTGDAHPAAAVAISVDGTALPVTRQGAPGAAEFFFSEWPSDNSTSAAWGEARVQATVSGFAPAGTVGALFVARTPETFSYDRDGNLTSDGRWLYEWDAENRLVAVETRSELVLPAGVLPVEQRRRFEFVYDGIGRRVAKRIRTWDVAGAAWQTQSEVRFLYDGWHLAAEFTVDGTTLQTTRRHVWGLDLSGMPDKLGGAGGLLATRTAAAVYAPASDGNGNIAAYFDLVSGTEAARFDYDPFGRFLQAVGPQAAELPFRFSSQYEDVETGLIAYRARTYSTTLGRWLSRDPIEEDGGENLYAFVGNDPVGFVDPDGRRKEMTRDQYWKEWKKLNPNRNQNLDSMFGTKLNYGCVGVTCLNLGEPSMPDASNCYIMRFLADLRRKEMWRNCECSGKDTNMKNARPRLFSIHLWNDVGYDGTNPDVTLSLKGKADLSNWDYSSRPKGPWNHPSPFDGTNFDYGWVSNDGTIVHANHWHDPNGLDGEMKVYFSRPDEWAVSNSDFNVEVWCVACTDNKF